MMLGAGALGRPRGMVWGGSGEEGSGWGTHVYLWWIHFDIWQNQYNIVKLKNKIKFKKIKKKNQSTSWEQHFWFVYPSSPYEYLQEVILLSKETSRLLAPPFWLCHLPCLWTSHSTPHTVAVAVFRRRLRIAEISEDILTSHRNDDSTKLSTLNHSSRLFQIR